MARLKAQPIEDLRQAVEEAASLKRHKFLSKDSPNCVGYEDRRLSRTGARVAVSVCSGINNKSETGWGFWVVVITNHGRSLEARREVDGFISVIKKHYHR